MKHLKSIGMLIMEAKSSKATVILDGERRLFSAREVAALFQCGSTTVWRWTKEGKIPKPIRIGGLTRWKLDELEACIAMAEAQRDTKH